MRAIGMFAAGLSLLAASAAAQITPPRGYRLPIEADYTDAWHASGAGGPAPFVAKADFNGDQREDEAWLLPARQGPGWVLFVYLSAAQGRHQVWQLTGDRTSAVQTTTVTVATPGDYETECATGPGDCAHATPERLTLALAGVQLVQSGGRRSVFWWDRGARQFKRIWISD